MDIPFELVEAIARGDVVLFIGAGLSMGAGLPGWGQLLEPLADRIGLPATRRTDLLQVAQDYENERGRQALISYILQKVDTTSTPPTDNHRWLSRLGIQTWVTTNYDDLLEQILRETGQPYTLVVRDQDLPYTSTSQVTLVKMHGDRRQPDNIIITRRDYDTYFRRFPKVKEKLSGMLVDKTFLFVGYSVNDPDFNQIRAEIAFDLHQHNRMAYAVLFDTDRFTLSDLRSRNIHVIDAPAQDDDYSSRLGLILGEIGHRANTLRQSRAELISYTGSREAVEVEDIRDLIEAMGYRIFAVKALGDDYYYLCHAKWGAEIRQEVIHFVGGTPHPEDIASLSDAVISNNASRGTLLTRQPLSDAMRRLILQREHIQCYSLDEFINRLADFTSYLEHLVYEHENGEIPQFYVPLTGAKKDDEGRSTRVFKPLESFIDDWINKREGNHLSILGDFGSGKTWFCQRYAYLSAKRYLSDPVHNRIPILISLRNYSRAYDVEQLMTDVIVNRYKVALPSGYKTFGELNRAGKLLLIFDGFDEMEQRVSDYRTTIDNFWELAKVVHPDSKVLLTCRTAYFRHRHEEVETLAPRQRPFTMITRSQVIDLQNRQGFDVVHLLDFSDDDIRLALQKRLPASWEPLYSRIYAFTNLRDLASRPVLLDMVVKTLPYIEDTHEINQASLYETYINNLLHRRPTEDTDYLTASDRLFFVQELAWEMYVSQRFSISFSEFPDRVRQHFKLEDDPERVAFFERDVRTQTYLVRDENGNYRFAHKSFLEFLVARKYAHLLRDSRFDTALSVNVTAEIYQFLINMPLDDIDVDELIRVIRATGSYARLKDLIRIAGLTGKVELTQVLADVLGFSLSRQREADWLSFRELDGERLHNIVISAMGKLPPTALPILDQNRTKAISFRKWRLKQALERAMQVIQQRHPGNEGFEDQIQGASNEDGVNGVG